MYVNKCIKCGREFETKNPKRVICPDCLYPDKKMMVNAPEDGGANQEVQQDKQQYYSSYSAGGEEQQQRPYSQTQRNYNSQGGRPQRAGSFRQNNSYSGGQRYSKPRMQNRQGGFRNSGGGRRPQNNRFNGRKPSRPKAPKQLLVSREQLEQIELLYKLMLPLPNPDAHEVIGEKIGLEPRKVFFGINLVRQKMMLPKLPFPKRKLAITPDQMNAIKMLYEPLLPVPPIGCHKIIANQLKMDEWRVHVGIGLIRAQMGLLRWNQDRPDVPEEFKNQNSSVSENENSEVEAPKKKRGRPKKESVESSDE